MNETDAMKLLAEANPVRAEDLAASELPDLSRRRHPKRRLAVAIAVVATAAAASLLGVFVFGGTSKHQPLIRGEASLVPPPTLEHPLPPSAKQISLSAGEAILGAPIVLPDVSLAGPSDAGAVWLQDLRPHWADVAITFPDAGLIVYYLRPSQYPEAPLAMYRDEAKSQTGTSVIDLSGVPALATAQNSDQTGQNFGAVEFVVDGTQVDVLGHYDEATLQAVAQSIVDRSSLASMSPPTQALGPGTPDLHVASAAAADALLPFRVILPSAKPLVIEVTPPSAPAKQVSLFFNTPRTGPYEVVETLRSKVGGDYTVAALRETAKRWHVGPIHQIVVVKGVHVLIQGWTHGSLTATWLRRDGAGRVYTWVKGPEDVERGDVSGTFAKSAALGIVRDLVAQGG